MVVLSIINQKGGCGKTTSAINLGAALASGRKKTLLIDLDPQGHSALGLGVETKELEYTMYDVLDQKVALAQVVQKVDSNLYLAPSNLYLSAFEHRFAGRDNRESQLRLVLNHFRSHYDYILIDCPPNLGLLSINAMVASDGIIVPVEPSAFSFDGVQRLNQTLDFLTKNLDLKVERKILITMDERSRLSKKLIRQLQDLYENLLFTSTIRKNVSLKEAALVGQHILTHAETSFGARDYLALAKEVTLWFADRPFAPRIIKAEHAANYYKEICLRYYAPSAKHVQVAGDFNNWNPGKEYNLIHLPNGHWITVIPLKTGAYRYKFIVDGQWLEDPQNPEKEASPVGGFNSLIKVESTA